MAFLFSSIASIICAIVVQLVIVPWQKKKILNEANNSGVKFSFGDSDGKNINLRSNQLYFYGLILKLKI
jgi:hypothetical protein